MKRLWNNYSYSIVFIILSFIGIIALQFNLPDSNEQYSVITVQKGDTLWELSQTYKSEHGLTEKEFIHWVERNNGISGDSILSGDQLIIPVMKGTQKIDDFLEVASNDL